MMALSERIAAIPELDGVPGLRWQELPGGLTNTNVLIETGGEKLVLRFNTDLPGIDRRREARILDALAHSELSPELIANHPDRGYLLTRFVDEPVWQRTHAEDPERLADLALTLRRLHEHDFEEDPVDPTQVLIHYLDLGPVRALTEFSNIARAVNTLVDEVSASHQQRPVLCHNDLVFSNILGAVRPVLIDWEFAAIGNRLLDLALFVHYHDLDPDRAEPLLETYFGGPYQEYQEALQLNLRLAQALEMLWLTCRAAIQPLPERPARRLGRLLLVWG